MILGTESGIPPSDWRTISAIPLGLVFFLGTVYMLLRSNLGTKRAYLLLGTTFFGFLVILSLFWAFGAPGTPKATGPTNLPGQQANAYQPTWVPFAIDSLVAEREDYTFVKDYPEGFSEEVPREFRGQASTGATDTLNFFSTSEGGSLVQPTAVSEVVGYAEAPNGYPVVALELTNTIQPDEQGNPPEGFTTDDIGQPDPEAEPVLVFAFFDAGSIQFPSFVVLALAVLLFALHAFLLDRDERRERREATEEVDEPQRVPAGT